MSKIIEFQKFHKRKKLQNFLRVLMVISMTVGIGIFAYALIITEMHRPASVPSYIENKL